LQNLPSHAEVGRLIHPDDARAHCFGQYAQRCL
jgi:hypothetical protein